METPTEDYCSERLRTRGKIVCWGCGRQVSRLLSCRQQWKGWWTRFICLHSSWVSALVLLLQPGQAPGRSLPENINGSITGTWDLFFLEPFEDYWEYSCIFLFFWYLQENKHITSFQMSCRCTVTCISSSPQCGVPSKSFWAQSIHPAEVQSLTFRHLIWEVDPTTTDLQPLET